MKKMKKLFQISFVCICLLSVFAFTSHKTESISKYAQPLKIYHLSGNVTMSGGCVIHYEIDVNYSLIPPRLNGVSGTLTMGAGCSGSQTFSLRGSNSSTMTVGIDGLGGVSPTKDIVNFHLSDAIFTDASIQQELDVKLEEVLNNENLFSE